MFKSSRHPKWNWFTEVGTRLLRRQLSVAFNMRSVNDARGYLDSFSITSPSPAVTVCPVQQPDIRGSWFVPDRAESRVTMLYCHGGGYSFYPRAYTHFIAQIALAAQTKTLALDYRLAPEHRFPAQLEDAFSAYRWLLENGVSPDSLVVAGDSAGGNLALALLLAARNANTPLPALAVVLSPATGFEAAHTSNISAKNRDWINEEMLERWVNWFCGSSQDRNPLVSPIHADLRGLPTIYIQAGRAETLFATILAFVDRAQGQGVNIIFDAWEHMPHVFQVFSPYVSQSVDALCRIGEVVRSRTQGKGNAEAASAAGA
jgi:epsilon-lactone hydrolase